MELDILLTDSLQKIFADEEFSFPEYTAGCSAQHSGILPRCSYAIARLHESFSAAVEKFLGNRQNKR
ncbi:MAG: hypothetical protein IJW08_04295 [Lentisphaeria bacterium]|nr:hypothetical protein [Lentisphaeria bacterium]